MNVLLDFRLVYLCVFLAIVLPVLLWHREERSDSDTQGGLDKLPGLFKLFWNVAGALEFPFGNPVARVLKGTSDKYRKMIPASGLPLTAERMFTFQLLSFLGAVAIGFLFFLVPGMKALWAWVLLAFLAIVGWMYPSILLEKYVQWRQNEITRTLPFAIDLIGSAMRAGLEFGSALRYFEGLRMQGPLTEEFGKVLQQIELGKTRTEALADMAARVQVDAFTSFVGVVAYGTEIGASISDTLRVHGEELRRARFHLAERKAARAPSLMILPMAVFIMPAVFIIVITPIIMKMKGTGIGSH